MAMACKTCVSNSDSAWFKFKQLQDRDYLCLKPDPILEMLNRFRVTKSSGCLFKVNAVALQFQNTRFWQQLIVVSINTALLLFSMIKLLASLKLTNSLSNQRNVLSPLRTDIRTVFSSYRNVKVKNVLEQLIKRNRILYFTPVILPIMEITIFALLQSLLICHWNWIMFHVWQHHQLIWMQIMALNAG